MQKVSRLCVSRLQLAGTFHNEHLFSDCGQNQTSILDVSSSPRGGLQLSKTECQMWIPSLLVLGRGRLTGWYILLQ